MINRIVHLTSVILFVFMALVSDCYASSDNAFRPASYAEIEREQETPEIPELPGFDKAGGYTLFPPSFRYRIPLTATGVIKPLADHRKKFLKEWGFANQSIGGESFVKIFQQQVQVREGRRTIWIIWQDQLTEPFRAELSKGGQMMLEALFIGKIDEELVLLAIGFETVSR